MSTREYIYICAPYRRQTSTFSNEINEARRRRMVAYCIAANASLCRLLLTRRGSQNEHLLEDRATGKYFLSPGLPTASLLVISRNYVTTSLGNKRLYRREILRYIKSALVLQNILRIQ